MSIFGIHLIAHVSLGISAGRCLRTRELRRALVSSSLHIIAFLLCLRVLTTQMMIILLSGRHFPVGLFQHLLIIFIAGLAELSVIVHGLAVLRIIDTFLRPGVDFIPSFFLISRRNPLVWVS